MRMHPSHPEPFAALRQFRADLHACFYRRADALVDLTDALLTAGQVLAPVHLSLAPAHRRVMDDSLSD